MFNKAKTKAKPLAYSREDIKQKFINQVITVVRYWDMTAQNKFEAASGVAFSILNILDGGSVLPAFSVTPDPHPSDMQYLKDSGRNWYPSNANISGSLHELYLSESATKLKDLKQEQVKEKSMFTMEIVPYDYKGEYEDKVKRSFQSPVVPRKGDLVAYKSDAGLEFASVPVTDVLVDFEKNCNIEVYVDLSGYEEKPNKEGQNEQATTN